MSPYLFNVYTDDVSTRLNNIGIGCNLGNLSNNHLMCADDLVLISPSTRGLFKLIKECEKYGMESEILYNPLKSAVMFFRPKYMLKLEMPVFKLNDANIKVVNEFTYLGHILSDNMSRIYIMRQRRKIYAQGNNLRRNFFMCYLDIQLTLFRLYIGSLYTFQL